MLQNRGTRDNACTGDITPETDELPLIRITVKLHGRPIASANAAIRRRLTHAVGV